MDIIIFGGVFIKAVRLVVEEGRLISEMVRELYQKYVFENSEEEKEAA